MAPLVGPEINFLPRKEQFISIQNEIIRVDNQKGRTLPQRRILEFSEFFGELLEDLRLYFCDFTLRQSYQLIDWVIDVMRIDSLIFGISSELMQSPCWLFASRLHLTNDWNNVHNFVQNSQIFSFYAWYFFFGNEVQKQMNLVKLTLKSYSCFSEVPRLLYCFSLLSL